MSANAAYDVLIALRTIRRAASFDAPMAACKALGQVAETAVKVTLTSLTHAEGTPTPSSPGQPPSLVTGRLRRSIARTPPRMIGPARSRCLVGSVVIYASVHEFGPVTITSHGSYPLRNRRTGQVFGQEVTIPRRPFLETATRRLESTGMGRRVAEDAFRSAMSPYL